MCFLYIAFLLFFITLARWMFTYDRTLEEEEKKDRVPSYFDFFFSLSAACFQQLCREMKQKKEFSSYMPFSFCYFFFFSCFSFVFRMYILIRSFQLFELKRKMM